MPTQPSPTEFAALIRCPPDTVDDAHDFIRQVWVQRPDVTAGERMVMETALSELVTNVLQNNRHRSICCEVSIAIDPERLVLVIADGGAEVPEMTSVRVMPGDESEGGRGLVLVRLICDDLSYRRDGSRNVWRVEKRRSLPGGEPVAGMGGGPVSPRS